MGWGEKARVWGSNSWVQKGGNETAVVRTCGKER